MNCKIVWSPLLLWGNEINLVIFSNEIMFGYKNSVYSLLIQKRKRIEEKNKCSEDSCSILCQNNQALCWHDAKGREWLCCVLHRPVSKFLVQARSFTVYEMSKSVLEAQGIDASMAEVRDISSQCLVASATGACWIRNTKELQHIPIMA